MTGLEMKYFVLNPNKDNSYGEASRAAIEKYAELMELDNPELAYDLKKWVSRIETKLDNGRINNK